MNNIFASHNNIISSLGFTSKSVVENIHNEITGLKAVDDTRILPQTFYTSTIPSESLEQSFKAYPSNTEKEYTRLEKMMISSLGAVIKDSKIELTSRVGLIISTTKGNIDALDKNNPFDENRAYLSVLGKTIQEFFKFKNDAVVVSTACVSGILAVAIAKRYINQGLYDHVFITSGDVITEFVLSGFNSFQALSTERCKPFDKNRTGINLGEVSASLLVTNHSENVSDDAVLVLGESSCNDANHISGPSRTGEGLYRSIQSALLQSKLTSQDIDFISAHGTATPFNDEMESIAFSRMELSHVPLNSLKGYFGHTLGASGLLETIVGMHALHNNVLYRSLGFNELGTSRGLNVIKKTTTNTPLNTFIKTASGFGGFNTAVVFKKYKTN